MSGFYIATGYDEEGRVKFRQVNAKPILVSGAKGFDFFTHKVSNKWVITEGRTGMEFSSGSTVESAVKKAQEQIKSRGIKAVKDRVMSFLRVGDKIKNLSPRYLSGGIPPSEVLNNPLLLTLSGNPAKKAGEKRWVYGTRDKKWHLVGRKDRDWEHGVTRKEFCKLGKNGARKRYLSPRVLNPVKQFRSAKEAFGGKRKIPIEKYEKWLKTHGTKQDIVGFTKAKSVAINAGNPVKTVSLITINPGISGRTHLVRYGSSPEEWYHPPRGSAKAKYLKEVNKEVYKHGWKRRVPMYIDPQSGMIIKKLRPGQKADDWLRG